MKNKLFFSRTRKTLGKEVKLQLEQESYTCMNTYEHTHTFL